MGTARVFVTGSSDGIGRAAAQVLAERGHSVTLHARNEQRAREALAAVPNAERVLIGDLTTIAGAIALAKKATEAGPWDSVVHNAGLGPANGDIETPDGFASTFAVNSLAPYILTALMEKPDRMLYLSSGMHIVGDESLEDVAWESRPFSSMQAYADSKLHNVLLANYIARKWPNVQSCSLDPGWVRTKMVGGVAPGSVDAPAKVIADFAGGERRISGKRSGIYLGVKGREEAHEVAESTAVQDRLVEIYERLSGIEMQ